MEVFPKIMISCSQAVEYYMIVAENFAWRGEMVAIANTPFCTHRPFKT